MKRKLLLNTILRQMRPQSHSFDQHVQYKIAKTLTNGVRFEFALPNFRLINDQSVL